MGKFSRTRHTLSHTQQINVAHVVFVLDFCDFCAFYFAYKAANYFVMNFDNSSKRKE